MLVFVAYIRDNYDFKCRYLLLFALRKRTIYFLKQYNIGIAILMKSSELSKIIKIKFYIEICCFPYENYNNLQYLQPIVLADDVCLFFVKKKVSDIHLSKENISFVQVIYNFLASPENFNLMDMLRFESSPCINHYAS